MLVQIRDRLHKADDRFAQHCHGIFVVCDERQVCKKSSQTPREVQASLRRTFLFWELWSPGKNSVLVRQGHLGLHIFMMELYFIKNFTIPIRGPRVVSRFNSTMWIMNLEVQLHYL